MKRLTTALLAAGLLAALIPAHAAAAPSWSLGIDHRNIYGVGGLTSPYSGSAEAFARESAANAYSIQVTNNALSTGTELTCEPGGWSGSPEFAYRWHRNGIAIPGATSPAYTTQAADTGAAIQCAATATNGGGSTLHYSAPRQLGEGAPAGLPRRGAPQIDAGDGGAVGSELTCRPGFGWRWPDFGYRWLRNGFPIAGAVFQTYTLQAGDQGSPIQCQATGSNDAGSVASTSGPLLASPAPAVAPPAPSGAGPAIAGGDPADFAGGVSAGLALPCEGGPGTASLSYRWLRNGGEIPGATEAQYTTTAADEGTLIQCEVTATGSEGSTVATSAGQLISPSPAVEPPEPGIPSLSGEAKIGQTLTCDPKAWTGSPSFGYRWLRSGAEIAGATASTYTVQAGDENGAIQCQVTGANAGGGAVAYTKAKFVLPATRPSFPSVGDRPSISGTPEAGNTLTCDPGPWVNTPTYAYQWARNGMPIGGATSAAYDIVAADEGTALQCIVTATTASSVAQAASLNTVVSPPPVTPPPGHENTPRVSIKIDDGHSQSPTSEGATVVGATLRCFFIGQVPATDYTAQILRNGLPIAGATHSFDASSPISGGSNPPFEYVITAADASKTLQCMVTAANAAGGTVSLGAASFNRLAYVYPNAPSATAEVSVPDSVSVDISLPQGLALAGASGSALGLSPKPEFLNADDDSGGFKFVPEPGNLGAEAVVASDWNCDLGELVCTRKGQLAPGASYPPIVIHTRVPGDAPDTVAPSVTVAGGGASPPSAGGEDPTEVAPAVPFGVTSFTAEARDEAGKPYAQAGGHPFAAETEILANVSPSADTTMYTAGGDPREIQAELPPGFSANPQNFAQCKQGDFAGENLCDPASAVGFIVVSLPKANGAPVITNGINLNFSVAQNVTGNSTSPIFNLAPPKGSPAQLGFRVLGIPFYLDAQLRSDGDYGLTVGSATTPAQFTLNGARVTICADGITEVEKQFSGVVQKANVYACAPSSPEDIPFINNPSKCAGEAPLTTLRANSYQRPGEYVENDAYAGAPSGPFSSHGNPSRATPVEDSFVKGCAALTEQFQPSFAFEPDGRQADSPSGADVELHIPQTNRQDTLMAPALKRAKVTLPEGVTLNPAAGNGLGACTTAQMGLIGTGFPPPNPTRFDKSPIRCPDSSKIGTLEVDSPLLADPLPGSVYLAAQKDNVFGSDFSIYLGIDDPRTGLVIKLPGEVEADPRTGRLTTTFDNNPQLPLERFRLRFFGGPQAPLAMPQTCGTKTVRAELVPWSAADPDDPTSGDTRTSSDGFAVSSGPAGASCVSRSQGLPFPLGLAAGSTHPLAGAHSPFRIRVTRPDGAQDLERLELSPPPGFVASLRGIPYCAEAQIAAAAAASGKQEQGSPSCPPAAQIGTTNAGAGAGSHPYYARGKLYLAGPYKGAPLSVVAITPAVAGPFDLGNVVIRSALRMDPRTARITAITDPLPRILQGVPLRVRDIRINLDRPDWALNPTSCEPMAVEMRAFGVAGATTQLSSRYQLAGCERLGFKPRIALRLLGGTRRADHPALKAVVRPRPGQANIARAAVKLPRSAFLDQAHIRTICTRVQFAAGNCPKAAIYGRATAWTPLLDEPLRGPVYLRSSSNNLPDLVADLRGPAHQPIRVELAGRIDSVKGGIRNTFDVVPDAPVSRFVLQMQGGKKGLITNSRDLCARPSRARANLRAQNGRKHTFNPRVVPVNCKKAKGKKGKRGHGKRRGSGRR